MYKIIYVTISTLLQMNISISLEICKTETSVSIAVFSKTKTQPLSLSHQSCRHAVSHTPAAGRLKMQDLDNAGPGK